MAMGLNGQIKNCQSLRIIKKQDYGQIRNVSHKTNENNHQNAFHVSGCKGSMLFFSTIIQCKTFCEKVLLEISARKKLLISKKLCVCQKTFSNSTTLWVKY